MNILIVDDDAKIRNAVSTLLRDEGYAVDVYGRGEDGAAEITSKPYEIAILDVMLPGIDGLETLSRIRKQSPQTAVLMMSGQSSIATAVKATQLGARNFFEKPVNPEQLLLEIQHISEERRLRNQVASLQSLLHEDEQMIGSSPAMRELREIIAQIAPSDGRVLIFGENGTGKELVSISIHAQSARRDQAFVSLNCAAIPKDLVESELFGYEKGAFTGAVKAKPGRFEQADGGTLFLDEIGDMNLDVQAKLLRVLAENEAVRVGGQKPYRFDVRIVAATNKNLQTEIESGRFREDLYYRLNVIPIHVLPLRERLEDVPQLADHFLTAFAMRSGKGVRTWGHGSREILKTYHWPGNIRELRNFVERLLILSGEPVLKADFVRRHLPNAAETATPAPFSSSDSDSLKDRLWQYETAILRTVFRETEGNVSEMARRLKIDRANLHRKLKAHGIKSGCVDLTQR